MFVLQQTTNTQTFHAGHSSNFIVQDGPNPHQQNQHQYHQHSRTLPRIDNSGGSNRRHSATLVNGNQGHEVTKNTVASTQNHIIERSLDHQTPIPPLPPIRTAHIHGANSRTALPVMPPKMDSFNSNHLNSHGRGGINGSDIDGNSSSSSPPTDSISQRTSTMVAATATMPRGVNGAAMNGRKKKSVTIGTFTTVETFDPSSYEAAAV